MNEATCNRLLISLRLEGPTHSMYSKRIQGATSEELQSIHSELRQKGGANSPQHKGTVRGGVK